MTIDTKLTCPLGSTCEHIVDGVIERCAWYVRIEGKNPNTGEDMNESRCAMAWQPLLTVGLTGKMDNTAVSIQSLRNETIKRQDLALGVVSGHKNISSI